MIRRGSIVVDVEYSGGSSSRLTMRARYDDVARPARSFTTSPVRGYRAAPADALPVTRPMDIVLRPENAQDRAAKLEGTSAEHQTHDAAFDDAVYVETPVTDARVLDAILNEEVRAGVLELFAHGFDYVRLDGDRNGFVSTIIVSFASREEPIAGRGARVVDAFFRVLGNLPRVTHDEAAHAPTPMRGLTLALGVVGAAGWLLNGGYVALLMLCFQVATGREPNASWALGLGAFVVAVLAGVSGARFYGGLVRNQCRGRSTAHKIVFSAQIAAFGAVSVVVFAVLFLATLTMSR